MVRNGYGTKWQWYEMVMVRNGRYEMVMVRNDYNSIILGALFFVSSLD